MDMLKYHRRFDVDELTGKVITYNAGGFQNAGHRYLTAQETVSYRVSSIDIDSCKKAAVS